MPGRGWGLFAVKVPADFGDNKITWTIVANGKTTVIPASLKPDYEISPFIEAAVGNTPPVLSFDEHGPSVQGPQGLIGPSAPRRSANPLPLTVWVSDDAKFTSSSGAKPKNLGAPVTLQVDPVPRAGTREYSRRTARVQKIERGQTTQRRLAARPPPPRPSANPANTCCTSPPTITPAKAAPGSNAAGPPAR